MNPYGENEWEISSGTKAAVNVDAQLFIKVLETRKKKHSLCKGLADGYQKKICQILGISWLQALYAHCHIQRRRYGAFWSILNRLILNIQNENDSAFTQC